MATFRPIILRLWRIYEYVPRYKPKFKKRQESRKMKTKKTKQDKGVRWWARQDLNLRPIRYERTIYLERSRISSLLLPDFKPFRIASAHLYAPNTYPVLLCALIALAPSLANAKDFEPGEPVTIGVTAEVVDFQTIYEDGTCFRNGRPLPCEEMDAISSEDAVIEVISEEPEEADSRDFLTNEGE